MADQSYIGSGKCYLREVGSATPLAEIGNVSELGLKIDEETKELRNYQTPGGGVLNEVRRVKSVEVTINLRELKPTNLAMALYGDTSAVASGSVLDEVVTAYKGGLCRLAHANPTAVVVTNSAGTTTYVASTDYEVRPGGIYILAAGAITDAQALKVDYSYAAQDVIQALTQSGKTYELMFEGLNEAQSGKPFLVDVWRFRPGAAQDISLIGDDFMALKLTGKALADNSKATGTSQYFRATAVR